MGAPVAGSIEVTDGLRAARRHVESVCALLVSPTPPTLDFCSGALLAAVNGLAAHVPMLSQAPQAAEALGEARQLRATIARAGGLLQSAWDYHARWRQIVGAMSAGYTSRGDAAALQHRGSVFLRG